MHPPLEGLSPPTGIEPTPFRNLIFKVAGAQVHATASGILSRFQILQPIDYQQVLLHNRFQILQSLGVCGIFRQSSLNVLLYMLNTQ